MDFGLELGFSGQIWAILLEIGPICLDLGHFAQIWAIMLGFGPFCLNLSHIAWILATGQNLGQNRPQRRRSLENGSGGMNGRKDRQTSFPSGLLPCSPST